MKIAIGVAFATIILAACTSSGNPTAALDVSKDKPLPPGAAAQAAEEDPPKVMATGTSPIKPNLQVAFCIDQVAFLHEATPQLARAGERQIAADGSITIDVAIDKGAEGTRAYACQLDQENRFVGVTTLGGGLH
ncbi:hypothetical protein [Mesorhizobium marinum]|uniref:hypothetical protein n=1 Tax=Mesorhizobium marinum TaxID=3228790 RepID=UPI003464FC5F